MNDIQSLLIFLAIGAVAGWLAGTIMKSGRYGLPVTIVIGIVGALLGGYLFNVLNISIGGGLIGLLITSVIGAIAFLGVVKTIKKL